MGYGLRCVVVSPGKSGGNDRLYARSLQPAFTQTVLQEVYKIPNSYLLYELRVATIDGSASETTCSSLLPLASLLDPTPNGLQSFFSGSMLSQAEYCFARWSTEEAIIQTVGFIRGMIDYDSHDNQNMYIIDNSELVESSYKKRLVLAAKLLDEYHHPGGDLLTLMENMLRAFVCDCPDEAKKTWHGSVEAGLSVLHFD